jgi:hypothetical protein
MISKTKRLLAEKIQANKRRLEEAQLAALPDEELIAETRRLLVELKRRGYTLTL